jgi:hypothetical protein
MRSTFNDSILEAGLDERGEAPPPYNTAAADKAPSISRGETVRLPEGGGVAMRQIPCGERTSYRLPPGYSGNSASEEGPNVLARPATVVTVAERLSEADLEEQPNQDIRSVYQSRILPRYAGRWSSMRRLMSTTDGSV